MSISNLFQPNSYKIYASELQIGNTIIQSTPNLRYAAGQMMYVDPSGIMAYLPIGTSGQILESTGSAPHWVTPATAVVPNMQICYENSSPDYLISLLAAKPITIKANGPTDNLILGKNSAGVQTIQIAGSGNISTSGTVQAAGTNAVDKLCVKSADNTVLLNADSTNKQLKVFVVDGASVLSDKKSVTVDPLTGNLFYDNAATTSATGGMTVATSGGDPVLQTTDFQVDFYTPQLAVQNADQTETILLLNTATQSTTLTSDFQIQAPTTNNVLMDVTSGDNTIIMNTVFTVQDPVENNILMTANPQDQTIIMNSNFTVNSTTTADPILIMDSSQPVPSTSLTSDFSVYTSNPATQPIVRIDTIRKAMTSVSLFEVYTLQ